MTKYVLGAFAAVVAASIAIFVVFRGDPIADLLNQKWPAINSDQQRQKAIDSSAVSLASMTAANIAFGSDVKTIVAIAEPLLKPMGIDSIKIKAEQQLLRMEAHFHHIFGPDELPNDLKGRDLIIALKPDIQGRIVFSLGVSTEINNQQIPTLQVKLLPLLDSLHVDRLILAQKVDATLLTDALVSLLNRYAGNITSKLSEAPFLETSLPAVLSGAGGQTGPIKVSIPSAPDIKISVSAKPIERTLRLVAMAALINDDHVSAMAQIVPSSTPPATSVSNTASSATFDFVKAEFNERLKNGLDTSVPSEGLWLFVSKSLMANTLNDALGQARPCFSAQGTVPVQSFSKKVSIPDETTINCTPSDKCDLQKDERDCRRPPNCTHNHDERDCHGLGKIACEIAKAAQNKAYDAAYATCQAGAWVTDQACETAKGAQNAIYSENKLQCETAKTAKKDACETAKEGLKRVSRTGNFANIDGSMGGPASVQVCLNDTRFSDDLSHLSMNLALDGEADISTHIKFVPLDVVGHLACPAEWTDDRTIKASMPSQTIPVAASFSPRFAGGKYIYTGQVNEFAIKLHFDPSPTVILLRNANFTLACLPLAGLINAVTLNLGPFIPDLLKDFNYEQKPISFEFTPQLPAMKLLNHALELKISESSRALKLTGEIKEQASQ
jgi:hypothetical protein